MSLEWIQEEKNGIGSLNGEGLVTKGEIKNQ